MLLKEISNKCFLLIGLCLFSCSSDTEEIEHKTITKTSYVSKLKLQPKTNCFIVLNCIKGGQENLILIKGSSLYSVLDDYDKQTALLYLSAFDSIVINGLTCSDNVFNELSHYQVTSKTVVIDTIDYKKYFDTAGVLKQEYSKEDSIRNSLLIFLFKNGIYAYKDDYSGNIMIAKPIGTEI